MRFSNVPTTLLIDENVNDPDVTNSKQSFWDTIHPRVSTRRFRILGEEHKRVSKRDM